ncbi:DnaJ-domain-containing protein [Rhizoclosmatium globosum]|uniref:DnaJ-domain-containing protein n=1 Tax=Rhizoclosmatium globosum TaxID=329046 RepID=A0A1Y2CW62_9FUNG|nr:DnaJ-domain-containing protein [Rhizoclosmatium globosum]|eukprot:ORY51064.1 DnaJ-domain-containing protein [Rhizoclosmatium globosum]
MSSSRRPMSSTRPRTTKPPLICIAALDVLQPTSPLRATLLANRSAAFSMSRAHSSVVRDAKAALELDNSQWKLYSRAAKSLVFMADLDAAIQLLRLGVAVAAASKPAWAQAEAFNKEIAAIQSMEAYVAQARDLLKDANKDTKRDSCAKALHALESAFILADPSNAKQSYSTSSSSRLLSADLGNISHKWKLFRAEALVGLLELGEASKVVSNQVLSYDSTNSEALALRAVILYMNDSHPIASVLSFCTNALAYDPDNAKARVFLRKVKALEAKKKEGNDAYGAQDWEAAEAKYSEWLEEDTVGGVVRCKVLSNRAMVRSKQERHPACISDCTTAIDLLNTLQFPSNTNSDSPEPTPSDLANTPQTALYTKLYLRRADSYSKLEQYTDAIRDYTICTDLKPNDSAIQSTLQTLKRLERQAKRKDYYKILGIPRGSDENAIKKAYRKMALQYHPDKQAALPEEERLLGDAKFKEIAEAYSVLSDPQKKRMFDAGHDVDGASASGGMGGGNPFGGVGWVGVWIWRIL